MTGFNRRRSLDQFYGLLGELERRCAGKRTLASCDGRMGWPERGVYFFFEDCETREDGATHRVVRVGTHALRPSRTTLWQRLSQHKGTTGGSMPGGGNHRGSIFRLHVGTALLANGNWPREIGETWSLGSTASRATRLAEYPLEQAVTDHIGAMPFLWLDVDDPPSPTSDRRIIEAGAIALLSNLNRPAIDRPSNSWLGHAASREAIRESGLWNVNHVDGTPDDTCLTLMEKHLNQHSRTDGP